jgi:hypothetical protein
MDSDVWYRTAGEALNARRQPKTSSAKPEAPPTAAEVAAWVREFGSAPLPDRVDPPVKKKASQRRTSRKPPDLGTGDLANPFPPEFGSSEP